MRKAVTFLFFLFFCFAFLNAVPTAEEIGNRLIEYGLPLENMLVYTAETDPNEMLGRPNGYISKVDIADTRIEQISSPTGISIEVFKTPEDAEARKRYIDSIGEIFQFLSEYSYINDSVLLRVTKSLTPEQAEEYEKALNEII